MVPLTLIRITYCVCRQAERSIDYAIRMHDGLAQLRSYYKGERKDFLIEVLQSIDCGNCAKTTASSPSFSLFFSLIRICLSPVSTAMGWRCYSHAEIIWLISSLDEFHGLLQANDSRSIDELIRLRMRLYACQRILERGVILKGGLSSLGRRTEYLGQSDYLEFASISILLTRAKGRGLNS